MYGSNDGITFVVIKVDGTVSPARLVIAGDAIHGAPRAGAPIPLALTYQDAVPSQVDDGDVDEWRSDGYGRGYILDGAVQDFEILASAARTSSPSIADFINPGARGMMILVDVTAIAATPSVTPTIEARIASTANYVTLGTGTAITAVGQYGIVLCPGITVPGSGTEVTTGIALPLPLTWRLQMTHGDADSITYSVRGVYLK